MAKELLDALTVQQVTTAQTRRRYQVRVLQARSLKDWLALQASMEYISGALFVPRGTSAILWTPQPFWAALASETSTTQVGSNK